MVSVAEIVVVVVEVIPPIVGIVVITVVGSGGEIVFIFVDVAGVGMAGTFVVDVVEVIIFAITKIIIMCPSLLIFSFPSLVSYFLLFFAAQLPCIVLRPVSSPHLPCTQKSPTRVIICTVQLNFKTGVIFFIS